MPTIEYSKVVGGGAGWTKVATPDGRTMTIKGDRAVRNNNPGNLMAGPFADSMGAIGNDYATKADRAAGRKRGFAVFATREDGIKAQAGWYAKEAKKHPEMTIGQAISKYAPSFENNTAAYRAALTKAGGITADTKLADISPSAMQSIISAQHSVEGNTKATAFDAETGARIATIEPSRMAGATQVATQAAEPPAGMLASMFGDPLGLQAHAEEAPSVAAVNKMATGGFMSPPSNFASRPEQISSNQNYLGDIPGIYNRAQEQRLSAVASPGFGAQSIEHQIAKALGLVSDAPVSNFPARPEQVAPNNPMRPSVDVATTPEDIDRLTVEQARQTQQPSVQVAETPADIDRMTVEQAAAMAPQAPEATRFGAPAADRVAPDVPSVGGIFSPEHYASVVSPEQRAANARQLGADVGAMAGPAPAVAPASGPMSPDGKVADPFGNYKPGGMLGTVQKAETERMPGAELAYAPEVAAAPPAAPAAAPAFGAPKNVKDYNVATPQGMLGAYSGNLASLDPNMMGPQYEGLPSTGLMSNMAQGMPRADYAAKFGALDPTMAPNSPTISAYATDDANTFPDAPRPETTFPDAPTPPTREESFKAAIGPSLAKAGIGFLTGGPIGAALSVAGGLLGGQNKGFGGMFGPGPSYDNYGVGSGMNAISGVQGGAYSPGATAYSKSDPGIFSRQTPFGYDRTNTNFASRPTMHYDAKGNMTGVTYGGPGGGIFGSISRALGGMFGERDRDGQNKGLSKAGHDAIGKGGGGLY